MQSKENNHMPAFSNSQGGKVANSQGTRIVNTKATTTNQE
jgi:hypothetical protein